MITNKTDALTARVAKTEQTDMQVAGNAKVSLSAAKKVLAGSTQVNLNSIEQVANYLGFDVEIRYTPKKRAA